MHTRTYPAAAHRIIWTILALVCVALGGPAVLPAAADPLPPPERALVYVTEPEDITRIEALGLPVYARLEGDDDPYLLVGANPRTAAGDPTGAATGIAPDAASGDLGRLAAAGLTGRILDPDMTGATYYLVYPAPGRPTPLWERYGQLLLDDGQAVLLRAAPNEAERFAAAGVEIVLVTLTPKAIAIGRDHQLSSRHRAGSVGPVDDRSGESDKIGTVRARAQRRITGGHRRRILHYRDASHRFRHSDSEGNAVCQ